MKIGDKVKFNFWGKEYFGIIFWLKDSSAIILDVDNNKIEINLSEIENVH